MAKKPNMRAMRDVERAVVDLLTQTPGSVHSTETIRAAFRTEYNTDVRRNFLDKALASLENAGKIAKRYSLKPNVRPSHLETEVTSLHAIAARRRSESDVLTSLEAKGKISRSYGLRPIAATAASYFRTLADIDDSAASGTQERCRDDEVIDVLKDRGWSWHTPQEVYDHLPGRCNNSVDQVAQTLMASDSWYRNPEQYCYKYPDHNGPPP